MAISRLIAVLQKNGAVSPSSIDRLVATHADSHPLPGIAEEVSH